MCETYKEEQEEEFKGDKKKRFASLCKVGDGVSVLICAHADADSNCVSLC